MSAVTRTTTSGRTRKLTSAAPLSARPKKSSFWDWTWTLSWATMMSTTTARSSDAKSAGGGRRPAPEQDADADAQEAGHQQEVAEEADVPDLGRDPADEQQLDEEERRAGQEKPDAWIGQALDPEEDAWPEAHQAVPSMTGRGSVAPRPSSPSLSGPVGAVSRSRSARRRQRVAKSQASR